MVSRSEVRVELADASIDVVHWSPPSLATASPIVLLHDGLGSIAQWRDVPEKLALRSDRAVVAFDRPGHGSSLPTPTGPWPTDWLHGEAIRLGQLLAALRIDEPVLVGHSDGGSIAAIHSMFAPDHVSRLVLLAAHSWVEDVCRLEIEGLRNRRAQMVASLERHHAHPEALFEAWSSVWVGEEFSRWDIRTQLAQVICPTLVVQGAEDEYATTQQLYATTESIGSNATAGLLPGARHLLHHDAADDIVAMIVDFLGRDSTDI